MDLISIKLLLKKLDKCKGHGTSMITICIPPKSQISAIQSLLTNEYGTADNIKSRVNRLSVLSAITSAQHHLKLYTKIPDNGLFLFVGEVDCNGNGNGNGNGDGKYKKITIGFEPFKPVMSSFYRCDDRFHTDQLKNMLKDDKMYVFVIVDGNGCLVATYSGNVRNVICEFTVELPSKHGRGGQSALRFARGTEIARDNYLRKVAESVNRCLLDINLDGMILAGSANFKERLQESTILDQRLKDKIIAVYDISYGSLNGLNQAVNMSASVISNAKFIEEIKVLKCFFEHISKNTNKYVYGYDETIAQMIAGVVETLIIWEE